MKTEKIKIDSEYIKLQDLLKLGGAVETGGQAKVCLLYTSDAADD